MKTDYTHISVILDRTGSMETIRDDTIGGFNSFLSKQKEEPGIATMTLVQFDSQDPYEVIHHFTPISKVRELTRETYVPRASTPLLDAIGRGINDLEKSLARLHEPEPSDQCEDIRPVPPIGDPRPSRIMMVIITDGQENASREFRKDQIEKMIREKTENERWQFVFLSADLNAINDAMSVGFAQKSMLAFTPNAEGTASAWEALCERTVDYRLGLKEDFEFEDSDRKHPGDPNKS